MHKRFCTGAKHSFGIKMCTPLSISSLNITLFNSADCFYFLQEKGDLIRWLRSLAAIPFRKKQNKKKKQSILSECQECLTEIKLVSYTEIRASWNKTLDPFITHWPSPAKKLRASKRRASIPRDPKSLQSVAELCVVLLCASRFELPDDLKCTSY